MKKLIFSWLLSVLFLSATNAQYGVERTGYEGDYFSLEGAIELFKQSSSISDFERRINREDSWVNNLDLNYDGRIDYIRVEHRQQGNFHAIVLQVPISRYDVQDVAVIEIEKTGSREAVLQIVGDEYLYGEQVIVEPYEIEGYSRSNGGYNADYEYRNDYVNVYYWPAVQRIFQDQYQVYISPYRWQYYPTWWSPWYQCGWDVYHPRIVVYHRHYHVVHVHRVIRVHNFYSPYRTYCNSVAQRTDEVRIKQGKSPIQRPVVQQDKTAADHPRESNRVEQPPRNTTPPPRTAPQVNARLPQSRHRLPLATAPSLHGRLHKSMNNQGVYRIKVRDLR
ncbi:MAG: hypothetical protein IPJ40_21605 [Saprospirales bacterium]|nr:hypothetical protein [Saprospirales bacterium]